MRNSILFIFNRPRNENVGFWDLNLRIFLTLLLDGLDKVPIYQCWCKEDAVTRWWQSHLHHNFFILWNLPFWPEKAQICDYNYINDSGVKLFNEKQWKVHSETKMLYRGVVPLSRLPSRPPSRPDFKPQTTPPTTQSKITIPKKEIPKPQETHYEMIRIHMYPQNSLNMVTTDSGGSGGKNLSHSGQKSKVHQRGIYSERPLFFIFGSSGMGKSDLASFLSSRLEIFETDQASPKTKTDSNGTSPPLLTLDQMVQYDVIIVGNKNRNLPSLYRAWIQEQQMECITLEMTNDTLSLLEEHLAPFIPFPLIHCIYDYTSLTF